MDTNKMRAEFEAAFVAKYGFGRLTASANADAHAIYEAAKWAWQASRAAAVVELQGDKHTVECRLEVSQDTLSTIRTCLRAAESDIEQLKAENEALRKQVADDERKLDALLAHCEDGECPTCAQIICPHGGVMHFHHDGCPSCAEHEEAMAKEASRG